MACEPGGADDTLASPTLPGFSIRLKKAVGRMGNFVGPPSRRARDTAWTSHVEPCAQALLRSSPAGPRQTDQLAQPLAGSRLHPPDDSP